VGGHDNVLHYGQSRSKFSVKFVGDSGNCSADNYKQRISGTKSKESCYVLN
jgi:hypothetical protein